MFLFIRHYGNQTKQLYAGTERFELAVRHCLIAVPFYSLAINSVSTSQITGGENRPDALILCKTDQR